MNSSLFSRLLVSRVKEAKIDTPVVVITGPRQSGKTTLVRQFESPSMRYLTLDDESTLLSARSDPVGMVRTLDRAIIDEIQRAPQLLLAIKKAVDEDRRPGRFLLTGSANLMMLPTVTDSLAGRMENLTLLPLSQAEIEGRTTNWVDSIFLKEINVKKKKKKQRVDLIDRVLKGGYPEMLARPSAQRRNTWAKQYLDAIIKRDVRDIATIEKLDSLPRFLQALAQTAGQQCNYTQLGAAVNLDAKTAASYLNVFEQMFLVRRVEPWSSNRLKRLVKTPKLQFLDSGLLTSLLHVSMSELQSNRQRFGRLLETFVFSEILKAIYSSDTPYDVYFYRDADKFEVDFIIENAMGELIGVEVKAAATVLSSDLRGLRKFADIANKKYKRGILLYDGDETLPLGDDIWAMPVESLWL